MSNPTSWRSLLGIILLCATLGAQAAAPKDPYEHFFVQTFGDLQEDLGTAADEGKAGIMVFFEMDECPFCHWMKNNVLNQPEVQAWYREHFIPITIDIEGDVELVDFEGNDTTQKDFAFKKHRVRATPVIAFFDLEGKRVARYTGKTRSVEEFIWLGEYVVNKEYEKTSFTKYKRARKRAK